MGNQRQIPRRAVEKLRRGAEAGANIYLYGATGFGKTSTVEQVFPRGETVWIDCQNAPEVVLAELEKCSQKGYTVLDNLHCVQDEQVQRKILAQAGAGFRLVMIGRAKLPSWLSVLALQSGVLVISEAELRVDSQEMAELCAQAGLNLSAQRQQRWLELTEGNGMALGLAIRRMQQGAQDGPALEAEVRRAFIAYLDQEVVSHWSREVQTFLTEMSLVDAFTPAMAEYITGDDASARLLSQAECVGNILQCDDGMWRIRPLLLETLRSRAEKTFGRSRCNRLLYHGGRFEERQGHTMQALSLYRQCGAEESIHALLVREARKHMGVGNYWALRNFYQALSPQEVEKEPVLMTALSALHSVLMNTEQSEYWYGRLADYAAQAKGSDRDEAKAQLLYLDVILPHRGIKNMTQIFRAASTLVRGSGNALRPVSLTNNQPSVMNGGKDFCEWTKTDLLLANTIGPLVEKMLGKTGIGLVQTALGESTYEKGGDRFRVLSYLTKAQSQCQNNGIVEMAWVDTALQAKLALATGDLDYAQRLVTGTLRGIPPDSAPQLVDSIRAFGCWLKLYRNETEAIGQWLAQAPDETVEFCTLNRYLYMMKIYCYIALGKHTEALVLLQRMLAYADYAQRTYFRMECGVLSAIVLRRKGRPWKQAFLQLLGRIGEYHFVPILSEKGAAVLPLLTEVKSCFCAETPAQREWFGQVLEETAHMARLYPNYLKGTGIDVSAFSDTALEVLRLQAAGRSTNEIAQQLHISPRTVKYHASENYRKLQAKNMVDAVQIARSLNIL